jgi:hypothetical protein
MAENLPYQLVSLKDAFPDYAGGAKAFLLDHGDFVNKPKDCYVAVVEEDFTNLTTKTCDVDDIFGAEIALPNDKAYLSALYFKKNLNLPNGGFSDYEMELSTSLIVDGNLTTRVMNLSGGHTSINGNCTIKEVLYGFYNHGELTVNGFVDAPLIIADDYSMNLKGTVIAQYIMGTAWKTLAPFNKTPVWDVSDDAKKIKAVMDPFFMDANGFDGGLINIALDIGDCILKEKPADAIKRKKSDYYQLSDYVKAKLQVLEAQKTPVTKLQLGGCHMGQFPEQFKQFKSATLINLSNNSIKALPTWLDQFSQLRHLDLSTNDIKTLKLSPEQQANIESLNISDTLILKIENEYKQLPQLTELCIGKKDYQGDEKVGRLAIDFEWSRTPKLQHLHINETGWFYEWDIDFYFYQCKQLKYLHFGYLPRGKMGTYLSQLQQLEFYGFESGWQLEGDEDASTIEIDIDVLASLPHLQMLYITKDNGGMTADTISALRKRMPNLYICAPYAKFGFAMDDSFEKLNTQFEKVQNYQAYEPKNEATVQQMLTMVQEHRHNISPKWFDKTWLHILMHLEGKARDCDDMAGKSKLIKDFLDVTQLLKPHIAKTASWTHLTRYGYDLWELVYSAEIWYALRRADHNAEHLAWALEQFAIYLPIEQKQGHRKEFAGLYEIALELKAK